MQLDDKNDHHKDRDDADCGHYDKEEDDGKHDGDA